MQPMRRTPRPGRDRARPEGAGTVADQVGTGVPVTIRGQAGQAGETVTAPLVVLTE